MRWGVGVTVSKKAWSRPLTTKTWSALWAWRPATASQASKSARSTYCVVVADSSPKCSWAPNPTNHNRAPPTTPPPHQGSWPIENLWIFCLLREAPPLKAPDQSKECSLFRLRCSSSPKSSWPIQFCWFLFFVFLSCWLVFFFSIDRLIRFCNGGGDVETPKKITKKPKLKMEKKGNRSKGTSRRRTKEPTKKKNSNGKGHLIRGFFFLFFLLFFKWIFFSFLLFFAVPDWSRARLQPSENFDNKAALIFFFQSFFFLLLSSRGSSVFKRFTGFGYRVFLSWTFFFGSLKLMNRFLAVVVLSWLINFLKFY